MGDVFYAVHREYNGLLTHFQAPEALKSVLQSVPRHPNSHTPTTIAVHSTAAFPSIRRVETMPRWHSYPDVRYLEGALMESPALYDSLHTR